MWQCMEYGKVDINLTKKSFFTIKSMFFIFFILLYMDFRSNQLKDMKTSFPNPKRGFFMGIY